MQVTDVRKFGAASPSRRKVKAPKYEVMLTKAASRRYCRRVTAEPIEAHRLPPVPHTPAGIRALLPASQAAEFDAAWASLDLDDLAAVAKFRDDWWCRAAIATNPGLLAGLGDDEPLYPSPLR